MPGINRTIIITGPAKVEYNGQFFWSKGDVTVTPIHQRFAVESAAFGRLDSRVMDRRITVAFEPDGRFTAALAGVLWPYTNPSVGTSIYGGADTPLTIWGRDGIKLVVNNSAVTRMPSIRMGLSKTLIGQVEFTGITGNSTAATAEADYYVFTTVAYPGDTGYAATDIPTSGLTMSWKAGVAPWNGNYTEDGAEITFGLRLAEQYVDGLGTVDMRMVGVDVTAKATPVGPTAAQLLTAMQPSGGLGAASAGSDLIFTSSLTGGAVVTLKGAVMTEAALRYGAQSKRLAQCSWIATRPFSGAPLSPAALFVVAVA